METLKDLILAPLQYAVRHDDDDHDHDDEDEDSYAEVLTAKLVTMVLLFILSMIFGFAPLVLSKTVKYFSVENIQGDIKKRNPFATLLAFGGGVLLATTFIHLLPEINHNIEDLVWYGTITAYEFHLGPLLLCIGFFTMYFIEECVHLYINSKEKSLQRTLSVRHNGDAEKPVDKLRMEEQHQPHGHSHSHIPQMNAQESEIVAFLRGLLIVLALSLHELFEGFAVGLESTAHNVWYMFAAIAAHKLVICFCIGMELLASKTKTYIVVIYTLVFAAITSVGIGIGILLVGGAGATAGGIYSVVLQGLASGTLIYVIFFELLSRERSGMIQFLGALCGFIVMYGIKLALPHTHSHSHDCDDEHEHEHSHN